MPSGETIVYCAGPYWTPEEKLTLTELCRLLEHSGYGTYLPQRDGIEDLVWKQAALPPTAKEDALLAKAVLAMEVYQIVERCQALVFTMNGRVPDEGGVFKTALAYATGKPLVIYKNDNRSAFHGHDNTMITGLTPAFTTINRLSKLPDELAKALAAATGPSADPAHLRPFLDLGRQLWALAREHRGAGAEALFERIMPLREELAGIPFGRTL